MEVLLAAESSISPPGEEIISGGRDWPFAVNQEEPSVQTESCLNN